MKRVFFWMGRIEKAACATGLLALVLLVFLSAILRFFRLSMSWNIDLAMLLFAWTAFLGADVAWREGQIIGVDIVTRMLPRTVQRLIRLAVYLVILAALVVMAVFGTRLAWADRIARYQSMPIPYSLVTLSVVVSSISMVFSTLQKIRGVILDLGAVRHP